MQIRSREMNRAPSSSPYITTAHPFYPTIQVMTAPRFEPMDAQRFNLFKRRSRSTFNTKTISGHNSVVSLASSSRIASTESHVGGSWLDRPISAKPSSVPSLVLEGEAYLRSHCSSSSSTAVNAISASNLSTSSITLEDEVIPPERHQIDVFEKGDFTTTRRIIRPASRSSLFSCFSCLSAPTSRPTSPLDKKFNPLNSFSRTDVFEEELDYIELQRRKELLGIAGIKIIVTQEKTEFREERWRAVVQEVLYGHRPPNASRRTDSYSSFVEVN